MIFEKSSKITSFFDKFILRCIEGSFTSEHVDVIYHAWYYVKVPTGPPMHLMSKNENLCQPGSDIRQNGEFTILPSMWICKYHEAQQHTFHIYDICCYYPMYMKLQSMNVVMRDEDVLEPLYSTMIQMDKYHIFNACVLTDLDICHDQDGWNHVRGTLYH